MKSDISKLLLRKKKLIAESWINAQLEDATLREDLLSNEELREQSNELLDVLLKVLTDKNMMEFDSSEFEPVNEILSGISISRARQGFSSKETGIYIFSLKDAFFKTLQAELKDDPESLIKRWLKSAK